MLTPYVDHIALQWLGEAVKTLLSGLNETALLPTSAPVPPPRGRPSSGLVHPTRGAARSTRKTTYRNPGRDRSCIMALLRVSIVLPYQSAAPPSECCSASRSLRSAPADMTAL